MYACMNIYIYFYTSVCVCIHTKSTYFTVCFFRFNENKDSIKTGGYSLENIEVDLSLQGLLSELFYFFENHI